MVFPHTSTEGEDSWNSETPGLKVIYAISVTGAILDYLELNWNGYCEID